MLLTTWLIVSGLPSFEDQKNCEENISEEVCPPCELFPAIVNPGAAESGTNRYQGARAQYLNDFSFFD